MRPVSILIIDAETQSREELARVLTAQPGFTVSAPAISAEQGLELLQAYRPSLVLLGSNSRDGLEPLRQIKAAYPRTRCLLMAHAGDTHHLLDALKAGADGYLLKDAPAAELCAGIRKVLTGVTVVQETLKQGLIDTIRQEQANARQARPPVALTQREREILNCLTRQLDILTIARMLGISASTVRTHINHLLAKFNLRKRPDASGWANVVGQLA